MARYMLFGIGSFWRSCGGIPRDHGHTDYKLAHTCTINSTCSVPPPPQLTHNLSLETNMLNPGIILIAV